MFIYIINYTWIILFVLQLILLYKIIILNNFDSKFNLPFQSSYYATYARWSMNKTTKPTIIIQ